MDLKGAKEVLHIQAWLVRIDEINRELTWLTLARDLPAWEMSLQHLFGEAETTVGDVD
ncbi:hypothetical protein ACIA03_19010 [Nocardioides sp. NPDC051685]|uniref:hypothetical protein n=1 Tax=Nocardioides sp. NPDC051685 TaxID=3364334 RepID=UPI00379BBDFB